MKKKVLLLMPWDCAISEVIVLNLEKMGYEVECFEFQSFNYENSKQKIYNFFRKTFLGDKHYKAYLRTKSVEREIVERFNKAKDYFDYTLVIRPDTCSVETIHFLKEFSGKIIAYQWDGFSRFQNSAELIDAFDVFGVFDKEDLKNNIERHPNLVLTQNFYFDIFDSVQEKDSDLLYVGTKDKNRYEIIKHLHSLSEEANLKSYFRLYKANCKKVEAPIQVTNKMLSYKELLSLSAKSKCVIDIKHSVHNGLSLRFFEVLYFHQKVISDNPTVKEMDFYHPNNILVVEDFLKLTKTELSEFLAKEYVEIPKEIKEKYSFESWFNQMINKADEN